MLGKMREAVLSVLQAWSAMRSRREAVVAALLTPFEQFNAEHRNAPKQDEELCSHFVSVHLPRLAHSLNPRHDARILIEQRTAAT